MGTTDSRLDLLRGSLPTRNHNARTVAALAANPGCARRGVMDAAGIDKTVLATRLGFPVAYGQSPFAIVRGHSFEALVKEDAGAGLRALLHEVLGVTPEDVVEGDYAELGGEPPEDAPMEPSAPGAKSGWRAPGPHSGVRWRTRAPGCAQSWTTRCCPWTSPGPARTWSPTPWRAWWPDGCTSSRSSPSR